MTIAKYSMTRSIVRPLRQLSQLSQRGRAMLRAEHSFLLDRAPIRLQCLSYSTNYPVFGRCIDRALVILPVSAITMDTWTLADIPTTKK